LESLFSIVGFILHNTTLVFPAAATAFTSGDW